MRFKLRQQIAHRPGPHDQLHIGAANQRPEELELEIPRQGGQRADPQHLAACDRTAPQGAHQLLAGLEDRVGVIERDLPGFGQFQPPADPFEQRVAHLVLELWICTESADCDRFMLLGRPGQAAFMRDGPEIAKMVEVQVPHIVP